MQSVFKVLILLIFFQQISMLRAKNLPDLKISPDQRHIQTVNGKPFFWLGDTAWELFHRLNREEAEHYLKNRADKGFTVIQCVVLAEQEGLTVPNAYGEIPLMENEPTKPNEKYFAHVDFILKKANELGLYLAILPTWGDKFNKRWGAGPEIFTPENAEKYGVFLGKRYARSGLIWVLGGDRNPEDPEDFQILAALARGLGTGDRNKHLVTYHPMGGSSSAEFFHKSEWLDLNMFQSGHGRENLPNYKMLRKDFERIPAKPALDGEPCYEDHPINWNAKNGWFDDFDSRRAGYWSMLSGACGHTYGNHNVWQMLDAGRAPVSAARTPWLAALDFPGAFQAGYMRRILEMRSWQAMKSCPEIIVEAPTEAGKDVLAAQINWLSILIYSPYGSRFKIDLRNIQSKILKAWWINPRDCHAISMGEFLKVDFLQFDPPNEERRGNDWLLVVEANDVNLTDFRILNRKCN